MEENASTDEDLKCKKLKSNKDWPRWKSPVQIVYEDSKTIERKMIAF